MWVVLLVSGGVVAAYLLLHYVLFLLASNPKDAAGIGHELNQFERRQLVEWQPKKEDLLKHDDEHRTYDDVFGPYRSETDNHSTCVFPRLPFTHRYASDYLLLKLKDGMRLLDLGCGSGAAAEYFGRRRSVDITCVTNSSIQGEICRGKFQKFGGRLLIRSPGSLDFCRREKDFLSVTAFFENWRYNFLGANILVFKLRRLGFAPIRYRHLPFWAWGLTWNFFQHLFLWKYRLKMRTMVDLEKIIWRTSKIFVFGNGYNIVLASKPLQIAVPSYADDGLVMGPFYEGNDGTALYNPNFRPFTSPVPFLLMRRSRSSC